MVPFTTTPRQPFCSPWIEGYGHADKDMVDFQKKAIALAKKPADDARAQHDAKAVNRYESAASGAVQPAAPESVALLLATQSPAGRSWTSKSHPKKPPALMATLGTAVLLSLR